MSESLNYCCKLMKVNAMFSDTCDSSVSGDVDGGMPLDTPTTDNCLSVSIVTSTAVAVLPMG